MNDLCKVPGCDRLTKAVETGNGHNSKAFYIEHGKGVKVNCEDCRKELYKKQLFI